MINKSWKSFTVNYRIGQTVLHKPDYQSSRFPQLSINKNLKKIIIIISLIPIYPPTLLAAELNSKIFFIIFYFSSLKYLQASRDNAEAGYPPDAQTDWVLRQQSVQHCCPHHQSRRDPSEEPSGGCWEFGRNYCEEQPPAGSQAVGAGVRSPSSQCLQCWDSS